MIKDLDVVENRRHSVVPFTGGLDLRESKALVRPGTLADCLNYEVTGRGYDRGQGLYLYGGTYDSAVENLWWVAETEANSSYTGDFTVGGEVTWEGGSGIVIYWNLDGLNSTRTLGIVDVVGAAPDGVTVFTDTESGSTFTLNAARRAQELFEATYAHDSSAVADTVTKYLAIINTINTAVCAEASSTWPYYKPRIPGTGGITGGFQFRDSVYAARDYMGVGFENGENEPVFDDTVTINGFTGTVSHYKLTSGNWESGNAAGVLYFIPSSVGSNSSTTFTAEVTNGSTITNSTQANTVGTVLSSANANAGFLWKASRQGWSMLDLGYSVKYTQGEIAFPAEIAPLFLDPANVDYIDSGFITNSSSSAVAVGDSGGYATWTSISNVEVDDGSVASCTISPGAKSQIIEYTPISLVGSERATIIGFEARVQARQTAGTDVIINSIRIINTRTGEEYYSDNQSTRPALTSTLADYDFGGQLNLWGLESINPEAFQDQEVKIQVQFENTGASSRTVEVDAIWARVHFTGKGTTVWFWDGTTNVATGNIYSYDLHDGAFNPTDADAEGYLTLHGVTNPEAIVPGLEIYRNSAGTGTPYAITGGSATRNVLPSEAELAAADNSRWVAEEGNFYENDDGEAVYVCTGATPAFLLDKDDKFAYIRTPVARDKDKPRHVQIHANHLALGLKSGHVLTSVISSPNDFDTANGASAHPYRDKVTGLASVAGNAMGVMCEDSINLLVGTQDVSTNGSDPFRVQNVTPKTGAIEYTVADVFGPMYADYQGVTTIATSDKFGDFEAGRLTYAIDSFMRDRLQRRPSTELSSKRPVDAVAVRSKGQYRLYFGDGYFLSLYVGDPERPPQPMLGHYDTTNFSTSYVPTWVDSKILSTGRERIVMGTSAGEVYIVDGANGIQTDSGLEEVACWIELNPMNAGYPQGSNKTYAFTLLGDFYGAQNITASFGIDYLAVNPVTARTKEIGDYDAAPILNPVTDYTDFYPAIFTDGFSIKFQSSMDGSKPHTLHTGIHRVSTKGVGRNNTQRPR